MGKVIMSGIVPQLVAPVTGTPLGDLAVGSIIKLNESGSPVDYIVVNQGIPSNSSLYDSSCDGTWLLRKDCYEQRAWDTANTSWYNSSTIHTYLNGTFLGLFDSATKSLIKQVKIPYGAGGYGNSSVVSGSSGLSSKVFLLSCYEVGYTKADYESIIQDGAILSYFYSGTGTSALNRRIANLNGAAINWWLRTPYQHAASGAYVVNTSGTYATLTKTTYSYGIRPALILPSDILINDDGTIKV